MALTIEYDSNNSGGSWWLDDDAWRALEAAGWSVNWHADREQGRQWGLDSEGRWLGALASSASKEIESADDAVITAAIEEWQEATDNNPYDQGCNCCGTPHNFYVKEDGETLGSIDFGITEVPAGFGLNKW